ncbi:MAG: DinB family protein [Candidatus Heimdallarchaeota archaeon]|nr:DinB family protein [Candidatus Heimdallarchaeota archaeon]
MKQISVYIEFLEYLRIFGLKTIKRIKSKDAWNYKISQTEFSIIQTLYHTIQAIYEDAGNWFLKDSKKFIKSDDPQNDLNLSIDRMIHAVQDFDEEKLSEAFTFQWGETTTVKEAIKQNIFHTVNHFGQLRERMGILERNS